MKRLLILCAAALAVTACGGPGPKAPSGVKVGKPYSINGQTYYPEYDPHYDRSGTASWYGPGFHGKSTANGERFDHDEMTAAHPTLPMPSLVRVTNLENGRSEIVRINDRGPFKDNRLIDLSKGAAEALGVVQTGLARVRVQYLKDETEQYWAQNGLTTNQIKFAKNDPYAPDPRAGTRGGLDGVVIAEDAGSTQIADAAPMMAVTTAELEPSNIKVAPQLPPRRGFISEANADDSAPESELGTIDIPDENPEPAPFKTASRASSQPKAVHLYSKDGAPLTKGGKPRRDLAMNDDPPAETLDTLQAAAPSSAGGGWYVQAGSFAAEENARKLVSRIGKSYSSDVSRVIVSGKPWYRVRLGPFASRDDADDALSRATSLGAGGARVIRE